METLIESNNKLYFHTCCKPENVSGNNYDELKIYISSFNYRDLLLWAPTKHKVNPESVRLNNKIIPLLSFTNNPDSCRKALSFLDSATAIDSEEFIAYYNKLMFLYGLKQYDKAINTANELIRLRPNAHDLFMLKGNLFNKIGDTPSANLNFQKSLKICNGVLDTMHETNRDYPTFVMDKAVNLIMLGDSVKANSILKILYNNQSDDPV